MVSSWILTSSRLTKYGDNCNQYVTLNQDLKRYTMESYFAKYVTSNASYEYRRDPTQKQYQVLLHVDPGAKYELSVSAYVCQ